MITGKKINQTLSLQAAHALYREDGKWYHHLKIFPGILCDKNGYVEFPDLQMYQNNTYLQHGQDLHVLGGISQIPGYIPYSEEQKQSLNFL